MEANESHTIWTAPWIDRAALPFMIAEHLTSIAFGYFANVQTDEFNDWSWTADEARESSPMLHALRARREQIPLWVGTQILTAGASGDTTLSRIHTFIIAIQALRSLCDFENMACVVAGLRLPSVARLAAWHSVRDDLRATLREAEALCAPTEDFRAYRSSLSAAAGRAAFRVPWLEVHLGDMLAMRTANKDAGLCRRMLEQAAVWLLAHRQDMPPCSHASEDFVYNEVLELNCLGEDTLHEWSLSIMPQLSDADARTAGHAMPPRHGAYAPEAGDEHIISGPISLSKDWTPSHATGAPRKKAPTGRKLSGLLGRSKAKKKERKIPAFISTMNTSSALSYGLALQPHDVRNRMSVEQYWMLKKRPWCDSASPRPPTAFILKSVVSALTMLHANQVVHGCLHPDCIVIDGLQMTARVTELAGTRSVARSGRSKVSNPFKYAYLFPQPADRYLAPETLGLGGSPNSHVSPESDRYSLGAFAYFLSWLKHPVAHMPGDSFASLVAARQMDAVFAPPPDCGEGEMPPAMLRLVRECALYAPHARATLSHADVVVADLERWECSQWAAASTPEKPPEPVAKQRPSPPRASKPPPPSGSKASPKPPSGAPGTGSESMVAPSMPLPCAEQATQSDPCVVPPTPTESPSPSPMPALVIAVEAVDCGNAGDTDSAESCRTKDLAGDCGAMPGASGGGDGSTCDAFDTPKREGKALGWLKRHTIELRKGSALAKELSSTPSRRKRLPRPPTNPLPLPAPPSRPHRVPSAAQPDDPLRDDAPAPPLSTALPDPPPATTAVVVVTPVLTGASGTDESRREVQQAEEVKLPPSPAPSRVIHARRRHRRLPDVSTGDPRGGQKGLGRDRARGYGAQKDAAVQGGPRKQSSTTEATPCPPPKPAPLSAPPIHTLASTNVRRPSEPPRRKPLPHPHPRPAGVAKRGVGSRPRKRSVKRSLTRKPRSRAATYNLLHDA